MLLSSYFLWILFHKGFFRQLMCENKLHIYKHLVWYYLSGDEKLLFHDIFEQSDDMKLENQMEKYVWKIAN